MRKLLIVSFSKNGWQFVIQPNRNSIPSNLEWEELHVPEFKGVFAEDSSSVEVPDISYSEDESIFHPIRLKENTEYEFSLFMPFTKSTFLSLKNSSNEVNEIFPICNVSLLNYISFNSLSGDREFSDGYELTGRINFRNSVGTVHFSFIESSVNFSVEVVTSKINYETDFRAILNDLADIHSELILKLDNPTETLLGLNFDSASTPQAEILHFRRLMHYDKLPLAISTIIGFPAKRNIKKTMIENSAFVTQPDFVELQTNVNNLNWSIGGNLSDSFNGFTPLTLPGYQIQDNKDIIENRYVKMCLIEMIHRIDRILSGINRTLHYPTFLSLSKWRTLLVSYLADPFWIGIGECTSFPHSILMQSRIGYRDFLQQILVFQFGVSLDTTFGELATSGDLRPISELYEKWCYCQLFKIIEDICTIDPKTKLTFVKKENGYSIDLKRGTGNAVTGSFVTELGKTLEIKLFYIKQFNRFDDTYNGWSDSYSGVFNPDFSIQITSDSTLHWIHFDAKYRLDFRAWKDQTILNENIDAKETLKYKNADLHVMHSYRDAILGSRGCFILYPGDEQLTDIFVRHGIEEYRNSQVIPSVGAFPLHPNATSSGVTQKSNLLDFLVRVFNDIGNSDFYQEETGIT